MKALLASVILAAGPALAIDVPSGQPVELQEVLVDTIGDETWLRFRFVAPDIARGVGSVDYQTAAEDMTYLCDTLAIPYIAEYALTGDVIVISMSDRATAFGVAEPGATQFFEAYRVQNDACIWEGL